MAEIEVEKKVVTLPEKSKRDMFAEKVRSKYPEREYADDEALFGQANDDYDDYENQLNGYKEREGKFTEALSRDPRNAQFFMDMVNDKNPYTAVVEHVGLDAITAMMNDPEKKAEIDAADKAYVERLAKEKELEDEYNKNMAESLRLREQLDAQYGEAVVDEALAVIDQMCKDAIMGKITQEAFDMAMKVVRHEADVDNARSEGEIAGRNAKIEETLRKPQQGDGMPAMGCSAAAPVEKKKGFFDDIPIRKF